MLIPIKNKEIQRIIPAVATGAQFSNALGNPRMILQRVMISSIGGVITLLISQSQVTSQFYSIWLILGVVFLLYILWGPILSASRKNAKLKAYPYCALFEGYISNSFTENRIMQQHEQADSRGDLQIVENRKTWLTLELDDEEGFLGSISFPLEKKYASIRNGLRLRCVVFSNYKNFSKIGFITDAFLPDIKMWVGEYPYLLRPAFEEFCLMRLR